MQVGVDNELEFLSLKRKVVLGKINFHVYSKLNNGLTDVVLPTY